MNNLEAIKLITTKPGTVVSREGSISMKFENGKFMKRVKDTGQFVAITTEEQETLGLFKYTDQSDWYENENMVNYVKLETAITNISRNMGFSEQTRQYFRDFTTALEAVVTQ